MKYYKIEKSFKIDNEIIPQMNGINVKNKDDFFDNGSFGPNKFCEKPIDFNYLVPMYISEEDEDKTPTIISNYHGWWGESPWGGWLKVISNELKELIEQFNLGPHKFYPAKVKHEGKLHTYFVFQIYDQFYERFIDFDKTIFNNFKSNRKLLEGVEYQSSKFTSLDEMKKYARENWDRKNNYEKVVAKSEFKEIDFVTWYRFGDLVSERLKNAIEAAGLTGMDFVELPIPIEFSDQVTS